VNELLTDPTMQTLAVALHGLSSRQKAIANNVANVETPGFTASQVNFESSLAQAISSGDPTTTTVSTSSTTDPAGPNGNNVNIDDQTLALAQTNLQYETLIEGLNAKYAQLRAAIA
jgi:flagellar basal-body rod protein FlgB